VARIAFFDIETRKWASDLCPEDNEKGWEMLRAGKGGISALCIYDTRDRWLYSYDDYEPEAAARHLEAADLVVGYSSDLFDIPCLEGLIHRRLRIRSYDIYTKLCEALAHRGYKTSVGDLKLDRIAKRTLGRGKIDHGSNARELARRGQFGRLFRYCGDDVHLTHDLFFRIVEDGGLIGPPGFVRLEVPPTCQ
jgi:hypothetical protein